MNSYNYSYNVLINRLEAFAAGHLLIKRFTHGQIDLADMDQDEQYPFMHVVPNNIKPVDGGMQFDFQIIFADIPRDKEVKAEYQREVISDCVRLAQDLISEVKNGLVLFGFDVQLVTPPVIEPFMEEYKNTLTGVTFSLQLEVPWDWSACDIPAVWAVGGSSTGGSGSGIGLTLRVNGVDNAVQNILDLVAGTNITITDNGDGSVTFNAAGGGGGGGGPYVSTEYNTNHTTAQGNPYVVGDRVWYNGSVYACIANNDAINPTNPSYWTLQAVGYRLRQTPVDWNATSGDYQILNKPTLATVATTGDYNDLSNLPTIPAAQINSDWNAVSGVAEILNKPNLATVATTGDYNDLINTPAIPSGTVTSVGTAGLISGGPITTSGTVTTNMATNNLVGRYSAGSGIMQEIAVGSGLSLTGAGVLNNTATPTPTGYYGAWQDVTTQVALVNNTGYAMKFGTIDYENQVRMVSDGTNLTRITFDNTGIYNLNFSVQIQNTDNAEHDVTIWIRKNGVDVAGSAGFVTVPKRRSVGAGLEGHTIAGWNYLLSVVGGDYYQIMWSTTQASAVTLQFYAAGSPPPSTASTLCIVTQQAGIMAGTGITAINSLTGAVQTMGVGTSGTDFAVSSSGTAHTFNLPTASATNRGALSSADWSTFNGKQNSIGLTTVGTSLATLANPSAVRYLRINASNTVDVLTLAQLKSDLSISTAFLGTAFTNAGTGFESVTDLSFAVTANKTYKWRATIAFTATAASTFSLTGPASPTFNVYRYTAALAATTNAVFNGTAYDTGTNAAMAGNGMCTADGVIRVTANGTVTVRVRCATAGLLSLRAGSIIEFEEVL